MSKRERLSETILEMKRLVYTRDMGRCQACGAEVSWPGVLAHGIPQAKWAIKKYGAEIVHHPDNLTLVCHRQSCNDKVSISNHPREMDERAAKIREVIDHGNRS